jgi:type I restriction enzyme M protein
VLFINADREYREGKAQNHLRPEDIDKIVHAYRAGQNIDGYAKRVPVADIKAEDYNCNIRRYVDNAPPPEPHDVRAHLHGGVPVSEIDALGHFWQNYAGLRESIFVPRAAPELASGMPTSPPLADKRDIAPHINSHPSVTQRHAQFMADLADWWQRHLPVIEALAPDADNQHATGRNVPTPCAPRCSTASSAPLRASICSTAIRYAAPSPTTTRAGLRLQVHRGQRPGARN